MCCRKWKIFIGVASTGASQPMVCRRTLQHLLLPPLTIYDEQDAPGEPRPPPRPEQHSALRPLLTVALTCMTLSGFAGDATLRDPNNNWRVMLWHVARHEDEWGVIVLLVIYMLLMVWVTRRSRPNHLHGVDHLLIPEVVAFGFFFLANLAVESFKLLDENLDGQISFHELMHCWPGLILFLVRRWTSGNMSLLLAITITESISPHPKKVDGLFGVLFDVGWAIAFAQAVALFLNSTLSRSAALEAWTQRHRGSSEMALLYGFSLFYYTHGLALIAAIVFRKHEGAEHPPAVGRVWEVVVRERRGMPLAWMVVGFCSLVLLVVVWPCLLDHPPAAAEANHQLDQVVEGPQEWLHGMPLAPATNTRQQQPKLPLVTVHVEEPQWLHAVSQGMLSGPCGCFALTVVNMAAIVAAFRCWCRPDTRRIRASYQSALTWAVGGLGSLSWCRMLMAGFSASPPIWQYLSACFAFFTHIALASFSADTFAGRQNPRASEIAVVTFWASVQLLQGLAAEHHAATSHHADGSLDAGGLLVHLGDFAMCEFGLIVSVAWVSEIMIALYKRYSRDAAPHRE